MIDYICPSCRGRVERRDAGYVCAREDQIFPVVCGIPDFRLEPQPADVEKARELEASELPFEELMRAHIRRHTPAELVEHEARYELSWRARGLEALRRFEGMLSSGGFLGPGGRFLDAGCGKGSVVAALALERPDAEIVGLDFCLRYLVLGRKLLRERGLRNVTLVCASVENLPFHGGTFDAMTALDVIEHVPDCARGMRQMTRVLKPRGHLFLNSPNRFSVFMPEDHCRLWWIGFLPRRYMPRYAGLRGRDYYGVRLLSIFDLRKLMAAMPGTWQEFGVQVATEGAGLKRWLKRFPGPLRLLNRFFFWVIPSYNVLFRKEPAEPPAAA